MIGDSVEYLLSIVSFVESANGAGNDTLTAVDTGGFSEGLFKRALDFGVETAVSYADSADTLLFVAGSYAAAAEDTLGVVSDDGNGRVVDRSTCLTVETRLSEYTRFICLISLSFSSV